MNPVNSVKKNTVHFLYITWKTEKFMQRYNNNRPVSYSNGWTGCSMKWRLMRSN